tara:strand:- start:78928 stop:80457 length:1530 start_codon:yes stop_codon:yes gene_type:complete
LNNSWYKSLFIIANGILYLVSIALWISLPQSTILNLGVTAFTVLISMVLIVVYRKDFYAFYTSGFFSGFSKSFISAILVFGILGFTNYLAFKHPVQWDVTLNKKNSLTDQSARILKSIKSGLKFTVFSKRSEQAAIAALLDLYRLDRPDIDVTMVDIEIKPELVKQYGIEKSGTVLVEYEGRSQKVLALSELAITNAIIRVSRDKDPVIFYSTGHEEMNLSDNENEGGSYLRDLLKRGSYDIRAVNLSTFNELPNFVSALMIWGPKQGFHESELRVIESYLKRGGRIMVALDPSVDNDKVSGLRSLLEKWGVQIQNNLVVDRIKHINGSNGSVPMLEKYNKDHPITKDFKGQVFFPLVSSIAKVEGSAGRLSVLAQSSPFPASWGEMSLSEFVSGAVTFNQEQDIKGPLGLMAAWEGSGTAARMILAGNSTFVINTYKKFSKNFSLFLNSLSWLVDEDRLISFNLPVVKDEPVFISAPQLGIIFYFSVIFVPLGLIIIAVIIYRRRLVL